MTVNLQACKLTVVTTKIPILGLLGTSTKARRILTFSSAAATSKPVEGLGVTQVTHRYPQIRTPLDHTPSINKHLMSTYYVPGAKQDGDSLPTFLPVPSQCWEHHRLPSCL